MPYVNGKFETWKVGIRGIRPLLGNDCSDENSKKVGKEIYRILSLNIYKKHFENYDMETGRELDEFNQVIDCEDLNNMLTDMWNYCDKNLIWIDFD